MDRQKAKKEESFSNVSGEPRLVSIFEEANISAGMMRKQDSRIPFTFVNSLGYLVLPLYAANYYCTHENIITRMAENMAIYGGVTIVLATVYVGWKGFVEEGDRLRESNYERCFRRGKYPFPPSDKEGRSDFERFCISRYGRIPRFGEENKIPQFLNVE